jgi:hypothetical protein
MLIKGADFEMEQVKQTSFFDLNVMSLVNEGKDTERMELKLWGYGLSFETCVKTIIAHRLSLINKAASLTEYLSFYKKAIDNFISTVQVEVILKKKKEEEESDE